MACTFPGCSNRLVEMCLNRSMLRPCDPRKEQTLGGGSRQSGYWVTLGMARLATQHVMVLGTAMAGSKNQRKD